MESIELASRLVPSGWTVERHVSFGVILCIAEKGRCVTIDERQRGYALGRSIVRKRGMHFGRNWKKRLYLEAIAALSDSLT